MKTIKAFLTILIIATVSFAKAQDNNSKYHYHDNAFKLTKVNTNDYAGAVYAKNDFVPLDAKYHLHDNSFKLTNSNVAGEYLSVNNDFVIQDAKYHYHDFAVKLTTATIKVYGECAFCKKHIEDAAKVNGVSSAKWDETTQLLTVKYNDKVTNLDSIQQSEAVAGHDTEKYTASNISYNQLPHCCRYQRKSA
ncbi:MAG: heavy-metal-associated domain-containing protein [Ferruginibacter sp.]